jgi:molecular chaperone GrpE (heat shock protein)
MSMPRDNIYSEMNEAWETYLEALENSIDILEKDIEEAKKMAGVCTNEWCEAIEHVIDDLNNALFSISEPRWSDADDSNRIKTLKRRIYDIYVNYKGVYARAA